MPNFLGLDIGTTSIKAVLLDSETGKIISISSLPTPIQHSGSNQDEHDPQILFKTIVLCINKTIKNLPVHALAISSLAEAGLPLDESGNPSFPIIAWYDPRSQSQANRILKTFSENFLFKITGQNVSFSFGLFKYQWIKENHPHVIRKMASWLSVPDYILYRLTGNKVTDYTQASRTMLFDQEKKTWSDELLAYAGLDHNKLPDLYPSGTVIGTITKEAADLTGLPIGLPCVLGGHDHLCGAFASGGTRAGKFIDSSGTACATLALTNRFDPDDKVASSGFVNYIHVVPNLYVIKGGLKAAGKAIEWLVSQFSQDKPFDNDILFKLYEKRKNGGPLWLPFFRGSGTPRMDSNNHASLVGLTLEHSQEDIMIAMYEGLGFWLRENLETLHKINGFNAEEIITIGGTNQSALLRQIKANITNNLVIGPNIPESSAVGAALLAAVGVGTLPSYEKAPEILDYTENIIKPDSDRIIHYNSLYENIYLPVKAQLSGIDMVMPDIN